MSTAGTVVANGPDASSTDFVKYFNDSDLFELFEFNYTDPKKCETLEMLIERDGFHVKKTPTVDKHLKFLRALQNEGKVTGLSVNSNLYTKKSEGPHKQESESDENMEINSQDLKILDQESSSTQEDKSSAQKATNVPTR